MTAPLALNEARHERLPGFWPQAPGRGSLLLVRHGESEGNASVVLSGSLDHGLTERGRAQACALGSALRTHVPDLALTAVFTSALSRARLTASLLLEAWAPQHPAPRALPALNERSFGAMEGTGRDHPLAQRVNEDPFLHPEGGESLDVAADRALACLASEIVPATANGPVLVVAHGGINRGIIRRVLGLSWSQALGLPMGNCQLYHLNLPTR